MALAISHLTDGHASGSLTTRDTASISPTSGGAVLAYVALRATDLATMSGEVITLSGAGLTWTKQTIASDGLFDASNRMMFSLFLGTGTPSAGAVTMSTVSARACDKWEWAFEQITGQAASGIFVQNSGYTTTNTAVAVPTMSAFANANNFAALAIATDSNSGGTLTVEAGWTDLFTPGTPTHYCCYKNGNDTTPTATLSVSAEFYAIGVEISAAGGATTWGAQLNDQWCRIVQGTG